MTTKISHYPDIAKILSDNRDNTSILSAEKKWTYQEYFEQISGLAAAIKSKGMKTGQRIGLDGRINDTFPILFFALIKAGVTVVCMNPKYPPAEQVRQLKEVGGRAIIIPDDTDRRFYHDQINVFTGQNFFSQEVEKSNQDPHGSFERQQEATIVFTFDVILHPL